MVGNDQAEMFLSNPADGATIGYKEDLVNLTDVPPEATKRRVYDEEREFLGNYKTARC